MSAVKIIAEIGINHNGDMDIAKRLIQESAVAGADMVKFQKRNPDVCVPEAQKQEVRNTPWGPMHYIDYKHKLEFNDTQYLELIEFANTCMVDLFVSVWDVDSVEFMASLQIGTTDFMKIPSAKMTDEKLVKVARENCETLLISTGMSHQTEIDIMIEKSDSDVIFHSVSSYPTKNEDCNISYLNTLNISTFGQKLGYSGHEAGWIPTLGAVALGAKWVERHVTLNKTMWGSDQSASLNMDEFANMVRDIRIMEEALGSMKNRVVLPCEESKRKSLKG